MATRSRTSFQKRQKEIARMEKQRDKAARRAMAAHVGHVEAVFIADEAEPALAETG